jgi:hypothetical protein
MVEKQRNTMAAWAAFLEDTVSKGDEGYET